MQIGLEIAEINIFMYFQDSGRPPSWIWFTPILHSHDVFLDRLHFSCQWQMNRSDATEILRFHDLAYLAEECLFGPIFDSFGGF